MKIGAIFRILAVLSTTIPMALTGQQAWANTVIPATGQQVNLDIHKGTLIRLSRPAASVFIADPKVADVQVKSPTLVYVFGNEPGDTTLYAVSEDDRVIYSSVISVTRNMDALRNLIAQFSPNSDVTVTPVEGAVMLTGTVESAAEAQEIVDITARFLSTRKDDRRKGTDDIINRLKIAGSMQVNLQVKITEASRDLSKQLGFNWESSFDDGRTFLGILNARDVMGTIQVPDPITGAVRNVTGFLPTPSDSGHYFMSRRFGNLTMNGVIDALESDGLINVLAEPNLTALSGEPAAFLAGGEFPIPVVGNGDSSNSITIEYKKFGVSLTFTPTVLSNEHINLKVQPEVSQLTSAGAVQIQGFSIPALSTRRAETTIELGSGQAFALAGLMQNTLDQDVSKLPGLGNIPILGTLFRSTKFQRNETELVIIATPYLVRPTSPKNLMSPTDGFKAPNDLQRILLGSNYRPQPIEKTSAAQGADNRKLIGGGGFLSN